MQEIVQFLTENSPFYVATIDGGQPRVRPFGLVMELEGKLYFCTGNFKNVYQQMQANANIEISTTSPKGEWIRLTGKAIFDGNAAAKAKAFEIIPSLAAIYQTPDSPTFEVFYLDDAEATFCSFTSKPKTVKL